VPVNSPKTEKGNKKKRPLINPKRSFISGIAFYNSYISLSLPESFLASKPYA
jgi:hypothetical protein